MLLTSPLSSSSSPSSEPSLSLSPLSWSFLFFHKKHFHKHSAKKSNVNEYTWNMGLNERRGKRQKGKKYRLFYPDSRCHFVLLGYSCHYVHRQLLLSSLLHFDCHA